MFSNKLLKNLSQLISVLFVFLIMADVIVNILLNIFPVKLTTYDYFVVFDLIISLILTVLIIYSKYISKKELFTSKYSILLIISLLPINFLYFLIGHNIHSDIIKITMIICVITHIVGLLVSFREFKYVFADSEDNNLNYSIIILISIYIVCTILFFIIEDSINPAVGTIEDAIWYSVASITSTGYGDVTPISHAGRLLGSFLMVSGFVFTTFATASVASILTNKLNESKKGLNKDLYKSVNRISENFKHMEDKNREDFTNIEDNQKINQEQINELIKNQKEIQKEINELKEIIKDLNN